jgi:hypothetical protein
MTSRDVAATAISEVKVKLFIVVSLIAPISVSRGFAAQQGDSQWAIWKETSAW